MRRQSLFLPRLDSFLICYSCVSAMGSSRLGGGRCLVPVLPPPLSPPLLAFLVSPNPEDGRCELEEFREMEKRGERIKQRRRAGLKFILEYTFLLFLNSSWF